MSSTAEAAAALLAQQSPESAIQVVAVDTQEAIGGDVAQPETAVSGPTDTVAAPVPQEAGQEFDQVPEFSLGLPEPEDADWLEPDEPEDISMYVEPDTVAAVSEDDEYADPEVAALRKRLEAAEKKAAHYEGKAVKASRQSWEREAEKFYPLADLGSIDATSRRGFMRAAKEQHDRLKPQFTRFAEQEKARIREQAAKEWGKPLTGGAIPSEAADQEERIQAAVQSRSLARVFSTMLNPKKGA